MLFKWKDICQTVLFICHLLLFSAFGLQLSRNVNILRVNAARIKQPLNLDVLCVRPSSPS